jgi:hypothetical protein
MTMVQEDTSIYTANAPKLAFLKRFPVAGRSKSSKSLFDSNINSVSSGVFGEITRPSANADLNVNAESRINAPVEAIQRELLKSGVRI